MKILSIGGGAAGLYFGILMKKQNPAHEITVVERNRPYDTFGWGVVFSDQTLSNFVRADEKLLAKFLVHSIIGMTLMYGSMMKVLSLAATVSAESVASGYLIFCRHVVKNLA